jgi:hypothetical protein
MINSYFQTSIVAVASWFGPQAIRSMFSGQAGIAVVISAVQLISTLASLGKQEKPMRLTFGHFGFSDNRTSADRSAGLFFLIMTTGMATAIISHTYLIHLPIYQRVSRIFDHRTFPIPSEETPLLAEGAPTTESLGAIQVNGRAKNTHKIIRVRLNAHITFFLVLKANYRSSR